MKRIALIATTSVLVVAGSAFGASASSQAKPWLRLADTEPLTIRGVNFKAGEAITVTATMREQGTKAKRVSKAAHAAASGGFTVTLASVDIDDCGLIGITAQGASGDRASLKLPPRQCGALFGSR
jgi:hypothetical protein